MRHQHNKPFVGIMLGQRRRRWPKIKPTEGSTSLVRRGIFCSSPRSDLISGYKNTSLTERLKSKSSRWDMSQWAWHPRSKNNYRLGVSVLLWRKNIDRYNRLLPGQIKYSVILQMFLATHKADNICDIEDFKDEDLKYIHDIEGPHINLL